MALLERTLDGNTENFNAVLSRIEGGILGGSVSATLEDASDFWDGDARCSVRVFERYSWAGNNRVSLSVTLFQNGSGPLRLSGITSGGSQAVFMKINTYGEDMFLEKLAELV